MPQGFEFMDKSGFTDQGVHYKAGFKPLPSIAPNGQATYSNPQQSGNTEDPVKNFNLRLLEMLQQAQQGGVSNAPLYARANELENTQIDNSMASAQDLNLEGLRPGDALNARRNQEDLYNPEINALNDRIKLNNEAIDKFERAIKTAKEYGEEYAKTLKPDEATIQAVKDQMAAGFVPSASVIEKLGRYITAEDWNALQSAKGSDKTASQKDYEFAKSQGFQGTFMQWEDRNKKEDRPSETETKDTKKSQIIDAAVNALESERRVSQDHYSNPNTYRQYLRQYIQAGGTETGFKAAVSITDYILPSNQRGDLRVPGSDDEGISA